jgi:hypothetical protein
MYVKDATTMIFSAATKQAISFWNKTGKRRLKNGGCNQIDGGNPALC